MEKLFIDPIKIWRHKIPLVGKSDIILNKKNYEKNGRFLVGNFGFLSNLSMLKLLFPYFLTINSR